MILYLVAELPFKHVQYAAWVKAILQIHCGWLLQHPYGKKTGKVKRTPCPLLSITWKAADRPGYDLRLRMHVPGHHHINHPEEAPRTQTPALSILAKGCGGKISLLVLVITPILGTQEGNFPWGLLLLGAFGIISEPGLCSKSKSQCLGLWTCSSRES